MIKSAQKLLISLLVFSLLFTLLLSPTFPKDIRLSSVEAPFRRVFAQDGSENLNIAYTYQVSDPEAVINDILIFTQDKALVRASTSYAVNIFGVLQQKPGVLLRTVEGGGKPVAQSGVVGVNVTTIGGPIKQGDYITSSEIPGKGQKAVASGYVVGIALADFDGEGVGRIPVTVKVEYVEIGKARTVDRLFDQVNLAFFKNVKDPERFAEVIRYVAATLTVLVSFAIGFYTFSRAVPKGIEAIGRNPLAQRTILFSVILNIAMTIGTASIGIIAALVILRL